VLELDDRVVGPEPLAYFLAANYFTGTFEQHSKNLERLFGKTDHPAGIMAELSRPQVQHEIFEPRERVPPGANLHAEPQNIVGCLPGEHAFEELWYRGKLHRSCLTRKDQVTNPSFQTG
jgi:hypothetical protein